MLTLAAALALSASTAAPSALLAPTTSWWEKIVVTMTGNGAEQSCRYESSRTSAASEACDVEETPAAHQASKSDSKGDEQLSSDGAYTSITFERRFTPGKLPEPTKLAAGDQLLGGQIMALAIDAKGAVRGCEVLASSGEMLPDYGCAEARAEKFQASTGPQQSNGQVGYFTILVYGHTGQVV